MTGFPRRVVIGAALAWLLSASARGAVLLPDFAEAVRLAGQIALVEVLRSEPLETTYEGRKIDCGRTIEVKVLDVAKGSDEAFRFSMLRGFEEVEPGRRGVVFAFRKRELSSRELESFERTGASPTRRMLCRRAVGTVEALLVEEATFWPLHPDARRELGRDGIEVAADSFLRRRDGPSERLETSTATQRRHFFGVENVLKHARELLSS